MKKATKDLLIHNSKNKVLEILADHIDINAPIITEIELSLQLGISRSTVHNIYLQLVKEKVLKCQGKRKFITRKLNKNDFKPLMPNFILQSEKIENEIINLLMNGNLAPGGSFSESELARQLNCTTIPLREALIKLGQSGLFQKNPRKNWEVAKLTTAFRNNLYECREQFECKGARDIVELPDNHEVFKTLQELKILHLKELEKVKFNVKSIANLDQCLHGLLFDNNSNFFYKQLAYSIKLAMKFQQQQNLSLTKETHELTLKDHLKIINALLAKDYKEAIKNIKSHMVASNKFSSNLNETNQYNNQRFKL